MSSDLGLFSPESRTHIRPFLITAYNTANGPAQTAKEFGTVRSRRIHFLMFARSMKWDADPDWLFADVEPRLRTLQLVAYLLHLATGQTLLSKMLKLASIKKYIAAVASLMSLCSPNPRDFRYSNPTDSRYDPLIQGVYDEIKRFEALPRKREPFTPEMYNLLLKWVETQPPDSLLAALADWFLVGMFIGPRLSEWAQPSGPSAHSITSPQLNKYNDPMAFCLQDFTFAIATRDGRSYAKKTAAAAVTLPDDSIVRSWIRWRTQKNGADGEERMFTTNPSPGGKCCPSAMRRIVQRFVRLRGADDVRTPLAIFRESNMSSPSFISATHIEDTMRRLAATVYSLDPIRDSKALQLWSSHSLRIGACVILHAQGYTGTQIKWLLRWRSEAFMAYLRNLAVTANLHNITMDRAAAMPNFL